MISVSRQSSSQGAGPSNISVTGTHAATSGSWLPLSMCLAMSMRRRSSKVGHGVRSTTKPSLVEQLPANSFDASFAPCFRRAAVKHAAHSAANRDARGCPQGQVSGSSVGPYAYCLRLARTAQISHFVNPGLARPLHAKHRPDALRLRLYSTPYRASAAFCSSVMRATPGTRSAPRKRPPSRSTPYVIEAQAPSAK